MMADEETQKPKLQATGIIGILIGVGAGMWINPYLGAFIVVGSVLLWRPGQ